MTADEAPANKALALKQVEDALRQSERKYRNLITYAATAIYEIDFRTRRLVAVNDAMCEMLGYTREELLAIDPMQLLDDESRARFQARIGQWLSGQKPDQNVEFLDKAKNGREFCTLLNVSFTTDEQGRPTGAMVIAHDITERKCLEDELRSERELLQAIYNTIPVMLTIYDPNLDQIVVNKHIERVAGWTREDTARTSIMQLAYPDAHYRAAVAAYMQSLQPGFRDILMTTKVGTVAETSWANVSLRDGRQVGIGLDVTEQRREERRRARYTAVLEGINHILAQVVAAETCEQLGSACLKVALQVTGSKFGFVDELGADGLLHPIAISAMAWEKCQISDPDAVLRPPGGFPLRGLNGRVLRLGRGFFTNEPSSYPESIGLPEGHPPISCFMGVPLIHGGQAVGLVAVANRDGGYSPEQQEDLEALAPVIIQALEKKRAEQALLRRTHELEVLNRTNQTLAASLETADVLDAALEELSRLFEGAATAAWLLERVFAAEGTPASRSHDLVCRRLRGTVPVTIPDLRQRAGEGLAAWVAEHGQSLAVPEIAAGRPAPSLHHLALLDPFLGIKVQAVLSVPLWLKSSVAGVLQVLDSRPRTFDARDQSLAESIAAAAGSAIERAQLYEQARRDAAVRETLLREVNHRVKNNLSAILGLVHAEARRTREGDKLRPEDVLNDLASRVHSLATVHSILSAGGWQPIDLGGLAREIIAVTVLPQAAGADSVALELSAAPIQVGPEQAHQLALVLSELATNTLKYGRGAEGSVVRLQAGLEGDWVCLVYRDSGPGYPSSTLAGKDHSMGLWLVDNIVRTSLRGRWAMANDGGAVTTVWFPVNPRLGQGAENAR